MNDVYGGNAAQVMDAVFHKVDGKYDNDELSVAPVDTSNFNIEKGQSPQGNDQLTVKLPKGKKLSQDEISQITKSNGMSSYSVANNTGLGMVIITAN